MLTPEALSALLQFTLRTVGPATLPELLDSITAFFPELDPGTIHGALNDLITSGAIVLSIAGTYRVPNTQEAPL